MPGRRRAEEGGFAALLQCAVEVVRDDADWTAFLKALPGPVARRLFEDWAWQAHGGQAEPAGDWRVWLLMAGRGFGKTRAGAEWVSARARENPEARIALVGATRADTAGVMVEGESGVLAVARDGEAIAWRPTAGVLRFASGAEARIFSARAGDKLRGFQHHFAWADEVAKWRRPERAWDNLQMGLRLGARPRMIVTTTPRAVTIMRTIRKGHETVETGGRTAENVHLSAATRDWLDATYAGTRQGRQELDGVLFADVEGALLTRDAIEAARGAAPARAALARIVVGVDPPATAAGDACGIVVCGLAGGVAWVLDDRSVAGLRPEGWARAVADAARDWNADRIVAETNQGGEMVESVLRAADAWLPVIPVHATQGKTARAEPVTAAFARGKARFAGCFPALEDELAGLLAAGGYEGPGRSPDRADAMVWAMSELMRGRAEPRVRLI